MEALVTVRTVFLFGFKQIFPFLVALVGTSGFVSRLFSQRGIGGQFLAFLARDLIGIVGRFWINFCK